MTLATTHLPAPAWRCATDMARSNNPPRILVAEDDVEVRCLVAAALREDGYEVVEALDGGRLLVQVAAAYGRHGRKVACDVIVSDIRMPVCSGLEVLEGLRKAQCTTPVILMTAFGDEATREYVTSLRAVLFDKPFDVDDLRTAVMNLLPGHRSD
jgi:DNA-binding response OmpR family regulator